MNRFLKRKSDEAESSGKPRKVVMRKYDPEYIKYGFISAGNDLEPKAQCVECAQILSNEELKPSKPVAYGEHFLEVLVLLYNICCRMQPFIKQMCGSAQKFNANTRTNIKRLFKQPNLLLQSINQFSGPAYPWGVAGAAARVGASKHLDPLQQRIDALLECQGETN